MGYELYTNAVAMASKALSMGFWKEIKGFEGTIDGQIPQVTIYTRQPSYMPKVRVRSVAKVCGKDESNLVLQPERLRGGRYPGYPLWIDRIGQYADGRDALLCDRLSTREGRPML